jgi:hypothetical protein
MSLTRRIGAAVILLSLASISIAFGQTAEAPATRQKPRRERLLESALKGDSEAQFDLAKGYEAGRMGLEKDYVQAEHWYHEAAVQGDPFAQASLGMLYNFGKGVHTDYVQAYMWYALAAEHTAGGDRETIAEMRDSLGRRMTAEQKTAAEQLVRQWKPPAKPKPEPKPEP